MKLNPAIFREYDVRGIAGRDLTPEFAELLGRGYARFIQSKMQGQRPAANRPRITVSVGRDCRLSGEAYSRSLIEGMRKGGLDVIALGVCPTPLTYFSIFHLNLDGAIMITGSHNPADYNGFKICLGKDTIHGAQVQEIRTHMEAILAQGAQTKLSTVGSLDEHQIIPDYIKHLVKIARPAARESRLRIVVDAGNGTAGNVAPDIFRQIGAEVIELYCELDGRFPNHHPDPTVPANLRDLVAKVRETKASLGFGYDGDSDRIGLVDETGRIVYGDEMMVLFSRNILKEMPGSTIISEVKSSHKLYNDIAAKGGKPIMWKTGHSLIKAKMKESKAALAGEMSGHMFFADRYFGYDDAIYASLRMYEIVSEARQPLSSLLADLPVTVNTPEIRVDCEESLKFKLVEETRRRLALKHKINDIDGVRVDFGDSWGLVRASNTQPVLVLRFEGPSQARLSEVRGLVENELREAAAAIGHPPINTNDSSAH